MMQIEQEAIEQAIVAQAVDQIIANDDLYARVKTGIDQRLDNAFAGKVRETIDASIDRVIKDGFEREYSKYDSFGRPTGAPTSIAKELERLIGSYWKDRVGKDGKPSDSSYNTTSRAEWLMMTICADEFSKEMKQHVVNVGGALKDHFRAVLNAHVAGMLSEVFHVQSEGDRELKNPGRSCIDPPAKPVGAKA